MYLSLCIPEPLSRSTLYLTKSKSNVVISMFVVVLKYGIPVHSSQEQLQRQPEVEEVVEPGLLLLSIRFINKKIRIFDNLFLEKWCFSQNGVFQTIIFWGDKTYFGQINIFPKTFVSFPLIYKL